MDRIRTFLEEALGLLVGLVRPGARSLRENSGLAVLSGVLAIGLWIFVTNTQSPEQTRVLPEDIPVQAVNPPADVALAAELPPVRVRIRVEENAFDSLTAADFEATVDLNGLAIGTYTLPVDVRPLTRRGALRVEAVLPDKIEVKLAQLVSKSVPVAVEVSGEPPADFSMSAAKAGDEKAVVAGPQEKVDLVTQAVAALNISGRTESLEKTVRLEPRDQRGLLVLGVSLDPGQTRITIDIKQQTFSRALTVSPQVIGTANPGFNITNLSVSPATVIVSGSQSFIQQAVVIRTQPIDVDGADKDIVRTVSLDVPTGAKVIGNANVTVTIKITPASSQLVFTVPITATGLGDGLRIVGSLPSVQVVLFGPLPKLLDLNPNDIAATVDLSGKDVGKHGVKIKVTAPEGVEVRSLSPQEIEITLGNR